MGLHHENLVEIFDLHVPAGRKALWIFMDLCPERSPIDYFETNVNLPVKSRLDILIQIAKGIDYLDDNHVIHRDVKTANVLVSGRIGDFPNIKLTDFDFSKYLNPEVEMLGITSDVGALPFKAPEFFLPNKQGKIHCTTSVDIFAAGLTFLGVLQGSPKNPNLAPQVEYNKKCKIISIGQEMVKEDIKLLKKTQILPTSAIGGMGLAVVGGIVVGVASGIGLAVAAGAVAEGVGAAALGSVFGSGGSLTGTSLYFVSGDKYTAFSDAPFPDGDKDI